MVSPADENIVAYRKDIQRFLGSKLKIGVWEKRSDNKQLKTNI
jgi:hypothetical protein